MNVFHAITELVLYTTDHGDGAVSTLYFVQNENSCPITSENSFELDIAV